eukprot:GGOE01017957.1.p1 GENE.GGOE01017957.1~~GGOE01017957.1.p1  ORF type:complete len:821 (-),score=147.80 GGOE01017957.1:62-2398(-)
MSGPTFVRGARPTPSFGGEGEEAHTKGWRQARLGRGHWQQQAPSQAPPRRTGRPTNVSPEEKMLIQFCLKAEVDVDKLSLADTLCRVYTLVEMRKGQPPLSPLGQAVAQQTMLLLAQHATTPTHLPALTVPNASTMLSQLLFFRAQRDPCMAALEGFLTQEDRLAQCSPRLLITLVRLQAGAPSPSLSFMVAVGDRLGSPDIVAQCSAKDVSLLFSSFGKVGQQHPALFAALRERLFDRPLLQNLSSRELSDCLLGLAGLRLHDPTLVEAFADEVLAKGLDHFDSRRLSNMMWALATMNFCSQRFLLAVVTHLCQSGLVSYSPQDISRTLWAFAALGCQDTPLLQLFLQRLAQGLRGFTPPELIDVVWALAKLGLLDEPVMQAVTTQFLYLGLPSFEPQQLSQAMWAFATLKRSPGPLGKATVWHLQRSHLSQLKPLEISNLLWSVASLRLNATGMLEAVGDNLATCDLQTFTVNELATSVWAFASCAYLHRPMLAAVSDHLAQRHLDGVAPHDIANLLWAFATLLPTVSKPLLPLIQHLAAHGLDGFSEQNVADAMWACAAAGFLDDTIFVALVPRIANLDAPSPHKEVNGQLHPFFVHCQLNAACLPRTTACIGDHRTFRQRCAEAFEQSSRCNAPLQFREEVAVILQQSGVPISKEAILDDAGGYSADILVEGTRTVIEAAGPKHFLRCRDGRVPSGPAELRRTQLAGFGYTALSVPFYEWARAPTKEAKATYLLSRLRSLPLAARPPCLFQYRPAAGNPQATVDRDVCANTGRI